MELLIRLMIRSLGAGGTILAGSLAVLSVTGVLGVMSVMVFGCMGGLCFLTVIDLATGTSTQVTVTGHHWRREVRQEVAYRDSRGRLSWRSETGAKLEGDDLNPQWPGVHDDGCSFTGCRRPGSRTESYSIILKMPDSSEETCSVSSTLWPRFAVGSTTTVKVGGVIGAVYCSSSTPSAAAPPQATPAPQPTQPTQPGRGGGGGGRRGGRRG
jgi:hypothetical protein